MTIQSLDPATLAQGIDERLPVLDPHVEQTLRACEDPDIELETLAGILDKSPVIAARLLGLANSPYYGMAKPVCSLHQAIQILGMVSVRGIATGLVFANTFTPANCPHFQAGHFWTTAVLSAQLASRLAADIPAAIPLQRQAVHMAGLLHELGLLVLVALYPHEMDQVLAEHDTASGQHLSQQLRDRFGIDQYQVSGMMCKRWRLPPALQAALEHHPDRDYAGEQWPLTVLTGLSARWSDMLLAGADSAAAVAAEGETAARLKLDPARMATYFDTARGLSDKLQATASMFADHGN